jgi:hypothetical protein
MKYTLQTSHISYHLVSNQRLSQDTASTLSIVELLDGGDENITIRTPGSTPRVLDNESFEDTDLLVADSQDTVIKGSTATSGDDTRLVELEDILVSFDGDRDGGVNQSSLEGIRALGSDEFVTRVDLVGLFGVKLAGTILGSIGIVRFKFKTIGGSISNSLIHPASLATIAVSGAINDLLFREREEFTGLDEVETFKDTSGRERPAGTALALILNGGNGTLVSPINGVGESEGSSHGESGFLSLGGGEGTGSIHSLEFSSSQVSELVDGELDISGFRVESVDLVEVFNEDTESCHFFRGSVSLLVLVLPGRPHGGKGISLEGSGSETGESEENNNKDCLVHF